MDLAVQQKFDKNQLNKTMVNACWMVMRNVHFNPEYLAGFLNHFKYEVIGRTDNIHQHFRVILLLQDRR